MAAVRNPADIRNIALVGQTGSGKTTLTERLLLLTGVIQRMGSVAEGTTFSDWSDEEKHHKHSLRTTMLHVEHEGHMINLIDTPGLGDFAGHAISVFPAVETVAVVIDASRGIEPMTRRMMSIARDRNLPRMIIINKIDDEQADLQALIESIRDEFGPECLPINLPAPDRSAVVSVFDEEDSGATLFSSAAEAHQAIIEQIVEMKDDLMNQYLEEGDDSNLDKKKLHDAFEAALRDSHLIPVAFVSAGSGAGCDKLLHILASLLPNPLEGNPRPFLKRDEADGEEQSFKAEPDPEKPVIAHIFKVTTDPFVGKLGVFRVHQGTIRAKSELLIGDQKKPVRIGHLLKRQGKESKEVETLGPGDIGAVAKIDEISFDAVLHEGHDLDSLHLKPLPMPEPMYGLAIELKNHADETKFSGAIHKLLAEDPSLRFERISATKQTVLRGLGELHLRVVIERLKENYGIELITAPPRIAYKETITARAEGHHRHKKQTGGAGQFGEVHLRVEPLPPDHETGFEFVNGTVGGSIPRQFMPAIEKGVRSVLSGGAIAGYPMKGIRVEVYDGKYHAVDSKEIAFMTAGKRAFIDAVSKARPVLLEPFVTLEVTVPASSMGDIAGDLSTKRGRVQDTRILPGDMCTVVAQAPLSELQTFSNELKSMTAGAGSYTMEYSHDENTPPHIQQQVISEFAGHADDD
ncbi:MAG: elongation factor G [Phycisphaerales bacterium]|nr:elongation factor G [Planctomycetota bacterium]MCH8508981.1 elongation factor G [Phycisphaerales bacterium]